MKYLIIFCFLLATPVFAQDVSESDLDLKQQKAMALLTLISLRDGHRDENEYLYTGLAARLQNIREERERLAKKDQQIDAATLQNYSKSLEVLIADIQTFLK